MSYYTVSFQPPVLPSSEFTSNWKYRQFLQANATHVMKNNTMQAIQSSGNNPYAQNVTHNEHPSDLKQSYLQSRRRKATMVAPSIFLP